MTTTGGGWLRRFPRGQVGDPGDAAPMIICPHAGGGASSYRRLAEELAVGADAAVAQYPGRQDRFAEPCPGTIRGYAEGILPEALTLPGPVIVHGHSMGGLVAYELARLLEARGATVRLLVVSGANAPQFTEDMPDHPTDEEGLIRHMAQLRGTGEAVLGDRAVLRMVLPAMRADYRAFDAYRDVDRTPLAAPILALGGMSDPGVPVSSLRGWAQRTSGGANVALFPGGHFFIDDAVAEVARVILEEAGS